MTEINRISRRESAMKPDSDDLLPSAARFSLCSLVLDRLTAAQQQRLVVVKCLDHRSQLGIHCSEYFDAHICKRSPPKNIYR